MENSSTDTESEADDQILIPVIRLPSASFTASSNFMTPATLVTPHNLLVSSSASSNRSSISSTSSSSSTSSTSGSSGSNYFNPIANTSKISCDSGFSSVASSPLPQTPPLRTVTQPSNIQPPSRIMKVNEQESSTKIPPKQSTIISEEIKASSLIPLQYEASKVMMNTETRNLYSITGRHIHPRAPPKVPPRQYQIKMQQLHQQQLLQQKQQHDQQQREQQRAVQQLTLIKPNKDNHSNQIEESQHINQRIPNSNGQFHSPLLEEHYNWVQQNGNYRHSRENIKSQQQNGTKEKNYGDSNNNDREIPDMFLQKKNALESLKLIHGGNAVEPKPTKNELKSISIKAYFDRCHESQSQLNTEETTDNSLNYLKLIPELSDEPYKDSNNLKEMKDKIVKALETTQSTSSKSLESNGEKPLSRVPPTIPCRPSRLQSSTSTPSIKQIVFNHVPSPTASSQYGTSTSSSPTSTEIPYGYLTPDSSSPSSTVSAEERLNILCDISSSDELIDAEIKTISAEEAVIEHSFHSHISPSLSSVQTTFSNILSSNEVGATDRPSLPKITGVILKKQHNLPAVPPRNSHNMSINGLRQETRGSQNTNVLHSLTGTIITSTMKIFHDSSNPFPREKEITLEQASTTRYQENKQYNILSGAETIDACDTSSSVRSFSPSPPPLPTSSPPPLTPREPVEFFPCGNMPGNCRRSSFPSASILIKREFGFLGNQDSPSVSSNCNDYSNNSYDKGCTSVSRLDNQMQMKATRDSRFTSSSVHNSPAKLQIFCNEISHSNSSPSLPISKTIHAEKELQKAIESLKQLTTHEFLNSPDLIYI